MYVKRLRGGWVLGWWLVWVRMFHQDINREV